jgi:hypothetical protein
MKRWDFGSWVLLVIKTFNGADISSNDGNLRSGVDIWSFRGKKRNGNRLVVVVWFSIDRICCHSIFFLFKVMFLGFLFQLLTSIGTDNKRRELHVVIREKKRRWVSKCICDGVEMWNFASDFSFLDLYIYIYIYIHTPINVYYTINSKKNLLSP